MTIFKIDQELEAEMREIPLRPFQPRPKASEWALDALVTGLPALMLPQPVGNLLGYRVTDVIVLTLAGAATCGYAVMGLFELRSRNWTEMRLPILMAIVFNGAGLLATLVNFFEGGPILLPLVVFVATLIVTPAAAIALRRFGLADSPSTTAAPHARLASA